MQLTQIAAACRAAGCATQENIPMAELTSFRIGGPADLLVTAHNAGEAKAVRALCSQAEVPILFLGNGSNMLVSDHGVRGVVLRLDGEQVEPYREQEWVICPAGVPLKTLCRFARDNGLAGLEFAFGIPGTVGGAAYMNAGAYCGEMADVLAWAEAELPGGQSVRIPVEEMRLGYRHSVFMECGAVVTTAAFRLTPDIPHEIGVRMDEFMRRRREKQPLEYPSAGSFFKRPPGHYAGTLIESCGLKGYTVGGAQVSEKHAGFIINRDSATCDDVHRLADKVRECVYREHGVQLQPEVCFIG